jgi:hypothetical protein
LKENTPRIEKMKNDVNANSVPCYICDSVGRECKEKIESTLNFLGTIVRESVKFGLEESRRIRGISADSPMTSEDIIVLEKLFSTIHGAVRAIQLPLISPIRIIEEWAIAFLGEKLEQGVSTSIPAFLTELVKKLLALTGSIQDPYDRLVTFETMYAKKISVTVDQPIVDSLCRIDVHEPDATHIASAVAHQVDSHEKTVFVTIDYGSILARQDEIRKLFSCECSDPLYAIYHLTQ